MNENVIECNEFSPQNNGEISGSIIQSWTNQAIECWELKQNCAECSIKKGNYSFICQMPRVVELLMNSLGAPYEEPVAS